MSDETKVALVVGVGPGLGAAVARRFAQGGFRVGLVARHRRCIESLVKAIREDGGDALALPGDATREADMAKAYGVLRDEFAPPSVLVYNAGTFQPGGVLEIDTAHWEKCWRANCLGAYVALRQVLPAMVERGKGTILLTGATASLRGSAGFSALAAGKFGLRALAQSAAREFGPMGIHVAHVIIDGQIALQRTMAAQPDRPRHSFLAPEAIAEQYWHLHRQDPTTWTLELDLRPSVEKF